MPAAPFRQQLHGHAQITSKAAQLLIPSPNASVFLSYAKTVHFLSNYDVLEIMPTSKMSLPA